MQISIPADVLVRKFGEQAVLLHLGSERYYSLNGSALRIWELLSSGQDLQSTAEAVAAEYDVDADLVRADASALLDRLQELGLLSTSG